MERSPGSDQQAGAHAPRPDTSHAPPRSLPATTADARHLIQALLQRSGLSSGARAVTDALMVTSELVTNAIRHGGGLTGFQADVRDGALRLSVADRNPRAPLARTTPAAGIRIGGYGWPLVQSLVDHLTITPHGSGKQITANLNLNPC
ncbi:ATP-binding protein [Streptomyces sp. cmx-4-9]|uniref:ATP-binding protein n=1 Tax=Streptomyces sp. cmx-4-9 TaxID=2790941 RepID=UPI00397F7ED0